jgi:quercetin dioxygenase-like cupin family protein
LTNSNEFNLIQSDLIDSVIESSNDLSLKTLLTGSQSSGLISITEVSIDGEHRKLRSDSRLRIYYVLSGDLEFSVNHNPVIKLAKGDLLTFPSGSEYNLTGTANYLVINTPAFQTGDDTYL